MSGIVTGQGGYVVAAYAAYAACLGGLIVWVVRGHRERRRMLRALDGAETASAAPPVPGVPPTRGSAPARGSATDRSKNA